MMLATVETFLEDIRKAHSEADILGLLDGVVAKFSFRSAYLIEYTEHFRPSDHVLDTYSPRAEAWKGFFSSQLHDSGRMEATLSQPGIVVLGRSRFGDDQLVLRDFCEQYDLLECVLVPMQFEGKAIGVVGYSGLGHLDQTKQMALQLISYNLFATSRSLRMLPSQGAVAITTRERQVLSLAADGLTSKEIAERLDISVRTVNQYMDNVIVKLAARSRTHAVAEAIRREIIDKN